MTWRRRAGLLAATLAGSVLMLALFLANIDLAREQKRPQDAEPLARWLAARPADVPAARALTASALDSELPRRHELWRAAHAHSEYLAPRRMPTAEAFVRAGLFHWYELGPADRKAVLDAAAPLLRDPSVFGQLAKPLLQLTGDFTYLRRAAPPTIRALEDLRDMAVAQGRFADYRELRADLRRARMRELTAHRAELEPGEMIALLPEQLDAADAPLVEAILEELEQRAYEPKQVGSRAAELADFSIEQRLQPLTALSPFVDDPATLPPATRARLARALGDESAAKRIELIAGTAGSGPAPGEWTGVCGESEVCTTATLRREGALQLTLNVTQSDEVPPYVELFVDGRLTAEGEVRGSRTFALAASAGVHRFEVRIVNPRTAAGIQRRIRLS